MLILLACQRLHTDAATESQGNWIYRDQTTLQLVAIVAGLGLEDSQHIDVTVRPSLAPGLGSEQHHGVQPMAIA
jgi:hypothetical protein